MDSVNCSSAGEAGSLLPLRRPPATTDGPTSRRHYPRGDVRGTIIGMMCNADSDPWSPPSMRVERRQSVEALRHIPISTSIWSAGPGGGDSDVKGC